MGYIIGHNKLKMDPEKIDAIRKVEIPPETVKDGRYRPDLRSRYGDPWELRVFTGASFEIMPLYQHH